MSIANIERQLRHARQALMALNSSSEERYRSATSYISYVDIDNKEPEPLPDWATEKLTKLQRLCKESLKDLIDPEDIQFRDELDELTLAVTEYLRGIEKANT